MTSILKVDTIQKPDGTAPSASELGIDVAGSVVQTKTVTNNTLQSTTSTGVYLKGVEATFTPKYQDSKLIIMGRMPYRLYRGTSGNTAAWMSAYLKVNGSAIAPASGNTYENGIAFGNTTWGDFRDVIYLQAEYTHNTTSQITISMEGLQYTNAIIFEVNESSLYYSSLVILEIAQ